MSNATVDAILDNARAALPGVADDVIKQALFNTCDDLAREALRVTAPAAVDGDPASWLPASSWVPNYQPLLAGTMAALYGQFGKPYFNPDLAKANLDKYLAYRTLSRSTAAGTVTAVDTIPERIVSTIRAQISGCRDESIILEMFNVIQKIREESYNLPPIQGTTTDYTAWLSTAQYEESYLAILYGTLSRLYGQSNMPWFNLDLYGSNNVLFLQELDALRAGSLEPAGGVDGLLAEARVYLPGAKDETLQVELRRAIDEMLKITQVWQGDIDFKVKPGRLVYPLDTAQFCQGMAQIVRVIKVVNSNNIPVRFFAMQNIPELTLTCEPSQPETFTATLAFSLPLASACSCQQLSDKCGCTWGIPEWILTRWNEVFFDGLLWRMMMQPAKPYTNTEIGLFHGQRWRMGLADARAAAKQKNVYDGQAWQFPAFA